MGYEHTSLNPSSKFCESKAVGHTGCTWPLWICMLPWAAPLPPAWPAAVQTWWGLIMTQPESGALKAWADGLVQQTATALPGPLARPGAPWHWLQLDKVSSLVPAAMVVRVSSRCAHFVLTSSAFSLVDACLLLLG